jgi:hypothetical protein
MNKPSSEADWTDKCPVCQSAPLAPSEEKVLSGLIPNKNLICSGCGAVFTPIQGKFRLIRVTDEASTIWQTYGNKTLTPREWQNIALREMPNARHKEAKNAQV